MTRGIGDALSSTYSQTLSGSDPMVSSLNFWDKMTTLSGLFLVSRTGDEG